MSPEQIANRLNRGKPRRPKGYVFGLTIGKQIPFYNRKSGLLFDRKVGEARPTAPENFNCTAT